MRPLRIALCSFSYGAANGIARMDELLAIRFVRFRQNTTEKI